MITFGPIPSRRLGRSLGINNIPPKICSYACVYCQLGKTYQMKTELTEFYSSEQIFDKVREKVEKSREKGEQIDYITFVSDGEPTLDINLGQEIRLIKSLGIKVAVISNSSLLGQEKVIKNLMEADLISLKVDSVDENIWKKINRPHRKLKLRAILKDILEFTNIFKGEIITETMLLEDINDDSRNIEQVVDFLIQVNPKIAYLSIPIRPPAEKWVQAPGEEDLNHIFNIFKKRISKVEYLVGYEGNAFAFTGEVEEDILSITSVHPMREEALRDFLKRAESDWSIALKLINENKLVETEFEGNRFYIRKLNIKH